MTRIIPWIKVGLSYQMYTQWRSKGRHFKNPTLISYVEVTYHESLGILTDCIFSYMFAKAFYNNFAVII